MEQGMLFQSLVARVSGVRMQQIQLLRHESIDKLPDLRNFYKFSRSQNFNILDISHKS